jgi:hypothetical protein
MLYEGDYPTHVAALEDAVRLGVDLSGVDLSAERLCTRESPSATTACTRHVQLQHVQLQHARLAGARLTDMCFDRADFSGADLSGADLAGASFNEADFSGANFTGASFSTPHFASARLTRANLTGARMNWQSHALIAELLSRATGDDWGKRGVVELVKNSPRLQWRDFLLMVQPPLKEWALSVMAGYVQPGDGSPLEIGGGPSPQGCQHER